MPFIDVGQYGGLSNDFLLRTQRTLRQGAETPQALARRQKLGTDPRITALEGKLLMHGWSSSMIFEFADLIAWWAWRANVIGEARADQELDTYLNEDTITALQVLWVWGVQCDRPIRLLEGVQLVPLKEMPLSRDKEQFVQRRLYRDLGSMVMPPAAALVLEAMVPKVAPEIPGPEGYLAVQKLRHCAELLNCLTDIAAAASLETAYLPDNVPVGNFRGGGGGILSTDVIISKGGTLTQAEGDRFAALYQGWLALSEKKRKRLRRALRRLGQAKARTYEEDAALDLGIALEMILLDTDHGANEQPDQLSLTFRLRGAWLIGADAEERIEIARTLRDIYLRRSQVAHAGALVKLEGPPSANSIAERLFFRLITEGWPNWQSLILGAMVEADHTEAP
jgi:hypothetical protein